MLPGPIFNIELLTSSRRARFYWIRVVYALLLLFALWTQYPGTFGSSQVLSISQVAEFAQEFFWTFAWLQLALVLVVGPALVAPTISMERERRTIEYLLATDLTNAEIVLGKLLARVLHIGYAVLVGLPVLALASLLGGIEPRLLWAVFILTGSTMLSVAALAIGISVQAARVRDAIGQVYIVLIALLAAPPIAAAGLRYFGYYDWIAPLNERLLEANPVVVLFQATLSRIFPQAGAWPQIGKLVLLQTLFSAGCTAYSVWRLRRVVVRVRGVSRRRRWLRRRPMGDRPVLWKEWDEHGLWATGWSGRIATPIIVLVASYPVVAAFYHAMVRQSSWASEEFRGLSIAIVTMALCGGMLLLAARAAASVTGEREKDTWITLISTPLSAREIVWGKIVGNLAPLIGLMVYWAFVTLLRALQDPVSLAAAPFSFVTAVILAAFATTLGVFVSLAARSTARAQGTTMTVLLFVGGGYLFCCVPFMHGPGGESAVLTLCAPFLLVVSLSIDHLDKFGPRQELVLPEYVFGTFGYAVATCVLYAAAVARFDRLSGRVEALSEDQPDWLAEPAAVPVKTLSPSPAPPGGQAAGAADDQGTPEV